MKLLNLGSIKRTVIKSAWVIVAMADMFPLGALTSPPRWRLHMTKTENHWTEQAREEEFWVVHDAPNKMYLVIGAPAERPQGEKRASAAAVLFKESPAGEKDSVAGLVRFFGGHLPIPGVAHSDFTRASRQQKHVDADTDTHSLIQTTKPFHHLLHSVETENSECLVEIILGYWCISHKIGYEKKGIALWNKEIGLWNQAVTDRIIQLDYQGNNAAPPRDLFRVVYSAVIHGGVCKPNVIAIGNALIEKGYAKDEESIRWKTACGQKVNIS